MTATTSKREIDTADLIPLDAYAEMRQERRREMIAFKKSRRICVGPYATFYFECYKTMLHQVQEMLFIEKGGAEQLSDELRAYNPLIPKGDELVATVMFEIPDSTQRRTILAALGGVENCMELRVGEYKIKGAPESDLEYSTGAGKASSVQFIHFKMTSEQAAAFRAKDAKVALAVVHPHYSHAEAIPEAMRNELMQDLV